VAVIFCRQCDADGGTEIASLRRELEERTRERDEKDDLLNGYAENEHNWQEALAAARRELEELRRPALAVLELWDTEDCGITSAIELLRKAALSVPEGGSEKP
jgi:hypothetical protein